MSIKAKTSSGIFWNILANSSIQLANLLVFVLLARQLSLNEFGVVMLAVLVVNFFTIFVKEGVVEYLVQRDTVDDVFLSTAFWLTLGGGLLLTVAIAGVVAPIMGAIFGWQLTAYLQALSPVILFGATSVVQLALVRREFKFRVTAMRNFLNGVITALVALALAALGFGAWALILSRVVGALGAAVLLWIAEHFSLRLVFSAAASREILTFSAPIVGSRLMSYLATKVAELLLAFFLGPASLAIYRVGGRIVEALNALLLHPIISVALTSFSRVKRERLGAAFTRLCAVLFAFALPIYYGAGAIAPDVMHVFFGAKWADSALVMTLLCLSAGAQMLRTIIPAALKAADATRLLYNFSFVEVLSGMFWSLVTVAFGPAAVALGALIDPHGSLLVNRNILRGVLSLRLVDVLGTVWAYVVAALIMVVGVQIFVFFIATNMQPIARLFASIALGGVLYCGSLLVIGRPALRSLVFEVGPLVPRRLQPIVALAERLLGAATVKE